MRTVLVVAGCLLIVSACSMFDLEHAAPRPSENPDGVEAIENATERDDLSIPRSRSVSAPAGANFLLQTWNGEYWDMPPSLVLENMIPDIPIEYELRDRPDARTVRSPPSAGPQVVLDHLESICEQLNWTYNFRNGVLRLVDLETRMFALATQPGKTQSSISADALRQRTAESTTGSGGREEENVIKIESDPYLNELAGMLNLVLAKDRILDSRVNLQLLPSTNSVLVTATPNTLREIEGLLSGYNSRTSQIVRVHLTLYEVSSTNNLSVGAQLVSGRQAEVAASLGIRTRVPPTTTAKYGTPNVLVVDFLDPRSRFRGSSLIFEYLKSMADVEITLSDTVETRANVVATSESTRSYQYVASITQTLDAQGRSTVELENDELRTGWSITVQPTTANELVTVRLSLSRRTLLEERPYTYGTTSGINFVTDDFNRSMAVTLKDGETRLITSLTQQTDAKSKNSFLGIIPTRRLSDVAATESVMLMRVELI